MAQSEEEEETKQQSTSNVEQNSTENTRYRTVRHIRSIEEVQTYLEQFIPSVSSSTMIQAAFMKPISIAINISFICYNLLLLQTDSASNYEDKTLWFGKIS